MQERSDTQHNNSNSVQGEPTPTGRSFLAWINKYRNRHPKQVGVPLKLQDQYWIRAAKDNNDTRHLNAINAVRVKNGKKRV